MKRTLFFLLGILFSGILFCQTATSTSNGNWTNPLTWDCNCIPTPGYSVTINHQVTLNTDFTYSAGTITINSGGQLTENISNRYWIMNGGSLINNGIFQVSNLVNYSGSVTNNSAGNLKVDLAFVTGALVTNHGIIENVDSLYITSTGSLTNDGTINATQFLNANSFTNSNSCTVVNFFNNGNIDNESDFTCTNFYNNNTALNNGTIIFGDMTNASVFDAYGTLSGNNFTNMEDFHLMTSATFNLAIDFLNSDSVYHDAVFTLDGQMEVVNNMLNTDSLIGSSTGFICIGQNTGNSGYLRGNFTFCDNTPPGVAPYVDYNTGVIDPTVAFCSTTCLTGIQPIENEAVKIYPNPAREFINIEFDHSVDGAMVSVYDITGKCILSEKFATENKIIISTENFDKGIYLVKVASDRVFTQIITIE